MRRYQRPVYSLILRMIRDASTAEELAQDVFIKAYRRLETYDSKRKFSSWLFKIAHNATLDWLRRSRPEDLSLDAEGEHESSLGSRLADPRASSPEMEASRSDLVEALETAVGRLRPEYRAAVLLRFREGLSYQEIAEITELPLGTVKIHLHRARKQLASLLTEMGWAPGETAGGGVS